MGQRKIQSNVTGQLTSGKKKNRKIRLPPLSHSISQKDHLHVFAFTAKPMRSTVSV